MISRVTTRAKKLTVLAILAAALAAPTGAVAATTTLTVPLQRDVVACNGDIIRISGQLLVAFGATANAAGGFTFTTHVQPQGATGVDVQTGTKYLGTGVAQETVVLAPSGTATITAVNQFHLQATAGAQSYDVRETFHFTAFPDGTVTAFVDNVYATCLPS
jgi:hypothetical protein